jgi:hypothetical protein
MAMLCKTCLDGETARRLAGALTAAGVPVENIQLLIGPHYDDVRREPVGGLAGVVEPDDRIGTYAGGRRRRQAAGGLIAHPDARRQGSFADIGSDQVVTLDDAGEHLRMTDDDVARRVLLDAHVPATTTERIMHELHDGHAALVAQVDRMDTSISEALAGSGPAL